MKCKDCKFCEEAHEKQYGYCKIELPKWIPIVSIGGYEPNRTVYLGEYGGDSCDLGQPKPRELRASECAGLVYD